MKNLNLKAFDSVVPNAFARLASRAQAALCRIGDGIYEINGQGFTARMRCGTGHRKDILVTLLATCEKPKDVADLSKEIGLRVIARFHGEDLPDLSFDNEEGYLSYARGLAAQAEKFLLPYLLALRTDFLEIKELVAKNAMEAVEQVSKYQFPRNVRKEWL